MKLSYIVIVLCLLIAITLSLIGGLIRAQAQDLQSAAQALRSALTGDQMPKAREQFAKIDARWHRIRPFWMTVLEHNALDEVDDLICTLDAALTCGEIPDAIAAAGRLSARFAAVGEQMRLTWYNLL